MRGLISEIEGITVPELPEFEDAAVVFGAVGIAQNHYLRENFHKCIDLFSKMWHHHTEMPMLGYGAYVVFFQFCRQAFPEISDQTAARMVAGIDVVMYRPDDELRGLARLAVETGVDDLFVEGCLPSAVLAALAERGEGGKRWLAAFEAAHTPWFNVSTGDGFYHHHRSWADDLTVPFAALPRYVAQVRAGTLADRPTEALRVERERIAVEYRALWVLRRSRRRSTRCWGCAGGCSRSSRTTSSTASTGLPRSSSAGSAPSVSFLPGSAYSPRPRTSSSCTTPRSTRRCRT
jgi:pyruvate,water dikinase